MLFYASRMCSLSQVCIAKNRRHMLILFIPEFFHEDDITIRVRDPFKSFLDGHKILLRIEAAVGPV